MGSVLKRAHDILIQENNSEWGGHQQPGHDGETGVDLQQLTLEDLERLAESDC